MGITECGCSLGVFGENSNRCIAQIEATHPGTWPELHGIMIISKNEIQIQGKELSGFAFTTNKRYWKLPFDFWRQHIKNNISKITPRRFQIISLEVSSLTTTLFSFEVNWFNSSVVLRCFFQNFNLSFRHTTVLSERWWYRSSAKTFLNLLKEQLRASLEFNHLPIDLSRCCYRTTSNVQWKLLPLKELFLKSWQQAFLRLNDLSNARSLSNFQILIQETIELWTSRV